MPREVNQCLKNPQNFLENQLEALSYSILFLSTVVPVLSHGIEPSPSDWSPDAAASPIGDATDTFCSGPSHDGVLWAKIHHLIESMDMALLSGFFGAFAWAFLISHFLDVAQTNTLQSSSLWPVLWFKTYGVVGARCSCPCR